MAGSSRRMSPASLVTTTRPLVHAAPHLVERPLEQVSLQLFFDGVGDQGAHRWRVSLPNLSLERFGQLGWHRYGKFTKALRGPASPTPGSGFLPGHTLILPIDGPAA